MQKKKKRAAHSSTKAVQARVPISTYNMLKAAAKADGRSIASYLRLLLNAWAVGEAQTQVET